MAKLLLKIGGGILGVLIIGIFVLSLSLDGIVKSNIRQTTRNMLKAEVDVDDVSLSIFSGQGTIDGFSIQNPEGFDEDRPALQFRQIKLKIALSTLLSDTVIVEDLVIQEPSLYVEQTVEGNNFLILRDRLNSQGGSSYDASLIIDHLLINKSNIHLKSTIGEERHVNAEIAQIELTGIGREGNNTVAQTTRQVLEPVLERAIAQAAKEGLMDVVEDKVKELLDG